MDADVMDANFVLPAFGNLTHRRPPSPGKCGCVRAPAPDVEVVLLAIKMFNQIRLSMNN